MRTVLERDLQHFGQVTAEEVALARPVSPPPSPIAVRFDRVYGLIKCYPANEAARILAAIARTKTLSTDVIRYAQALGLPVQVAPAQSSLLEDFLIGKLS